VPWAQVKVPDALQKQIFPFCEDVLARLRICGCENQGTINFLELLQQLRPFFWRVGSNQSNVLIFHSKICSFRPLVPYKNSFLTRALLSDSTFYLNMMPNHFSSNGLPCVGKKKPKMTNYPSSGMRFMKPQLERLSHLSQLKFMA